MESYEKYTDEALVRLTLEASDTNAYGELVARHMNTVFSAITSIVSDRATAEDIAQETFIDGFVQLFRLSDRSKNERAALAAIEGHNYLTRIQEYQQHGYKILPGDYIAEKLVKDGGSIKSFLGYICFKPNGYCERPEECELFGLKPLRYLNMFMGRVWDDRWTVGFHEERDEYRVNGGKYPLSVSVSDGGCVITPAGTFKDCLKLEIVYGKPEDIQETMPNGWVYSLAQFLGKKEYYFARGVGIVRFDCDWFGKLKSSLRLSSYKNPSNENAYFPVALGCEWEYDEQNLTAEGYKAKRIMKVACGMGNSFMLHDIQELIFLGSREEYKVLKGEK